MPNDFKNYEDYFYYLHLNPNVRYAHLVGTIIGLLILPFALYTLKWWMFLVYFFFFYGFGFLGHWVFDGVVSRTAGEAPWLSFIYASKINLYSLRPKLIRNLDVKFYEKYPFVREVYPRDL